MFLKINCEYKFSFLFLLFGEILEAMSQISAKINLLEEQLSAEIPNSGGARKSTLSATGDKIIFSYEELKTTWDAVQNGLKRSKNGHCFGWRSSKSSYSWITYGEFIKRAKNFGLGLVKIGLNPGQLSNVGIYARNSVEWAVAQYGIWSQSAILIPIYDSLGPEASTFMISHAEIKIVICDEEQKVKHLLSRKTEIPTLKLIVSLNTVCHKVKKFAEENHIMLCEFTDVEEIGKKSSGNLLCPQTSDIAIICYTSGTTGDPKGVVLTHQNLMSASTSLHLKMGDSGIFEEDLMISVLPLAHLYAQILQLIMLMAGGQVGFYCGDTSQLTDDMIILQPTIFPAVPRLLNKLYDEAQTKMKSSNYAHNSTSGTEIKSTRNPISDILGGRMRVIFTAGAPIFKNVVEFYTKIVGCKVFESYGQTECSGACCSLMVDSNYSESVGSPNFGYILKLVDVPELEYYSENLKGEVWVKGSGVFKGYLKDSKKTAEALDIDGWLHTGDIGMWLPNGTLKIIDRKKNILKLSQGLYVALEKIEIIYSLSLFVSQIFVHGESLKSALVAIVVPEKERLLQWCNQHMKNCSSWDDTCKDPSVKKCVFDDLIRVGKEAGLQSFEQVKAIYLHPEVLTYEGGFLTPTSKLKRHFCEKNFTEVIADMINSL